MSKKDLNESFLRKRSAEIVKDKTKDTKLFDEDCERRVPRFNAEEIFNGPVLGKGGFCTVREVSKVTLMKGQEEKLKRRKSLLGSSEGAGDGDSESYTYYQDRKFISLNYLRETSPDTGNQSLPRGLNARYAIKRLTPVKDPTSDPQKFVAGVIDLIMEARFLSVIQHPHIIKMRAMAETASYDAGFYVVLDRLYDTLSVRLPKWEKMHKSLSGIRGSMKDKDGELKNNLLIERLSTAVDIGSALKFIHSKRVMYRDLKPDNLGFDVRDDIKIFDFGLVKELPEDQAESNEIHQHTGETGSLRYMAPEVALNKPYNFTCDVYSYAYIIWSMLSFEIPFKDYNAAQFRKNVINGNKRPKLSKKWPKGVCKLIEECWSAKISARPSLDDTYTRLLKEVYRLEGASVSEVDINGLDISNRTEKSILKMNAQ